MLKKNISPLPIIEKNKKEIMFVLIAAEGVILKPNEKHYRACILNLCKFMGLRKINTIGIELANKLMNFPAMEYDIKKYFKYT